jgi:hypothetical protein
VDDEESFSPEFNSIYVFICESRTLETMQTAKLSDNGFIMSLPLNGRSILHIQYSGLGQLRFAKGLSTG